MESRSYQLTHVFRHVRNSSREIFPADGKIIDFVRQIATKKKNCAIAIKLKYMRGLWSARKVALGLKTIDVERRRRSLMKHLAVCHVFRKYHD